MRQCRQEAASTLSKLNCFHDLRRPSLPATGCSDWPGGHFNRDPPSAKWPLPMAKICVFLGKFDPFRQLHWLAGGVGEMKICLTLARFWPSANEFLGGKGHPARHCPHPEGAE